MNILLIILLVIIGIIALIFIIGLVSKKSYVIQRQITIHEPVGKVFNYVRHLKNQDYFNKWVMMDPNLKKDFRGVDGTQGFIYAWEGNKRAGKGEQEIKKVNENNRIDMEVRFEKPFKGISQSYFTTAQVNPLETNLSWGFSSTMKYPANIMLLFMNMEKMLGKDMETSLDTLRTILEKNS
jgi:hypothetical protein